MGILKTTWSLPSEVNAALLLLLFGLVSIVDSIQHYLVNVNLNHLSDDPETFMKFEYLIQTVIMTPLAFTVKPILEVKPWKVVAALIFTRGLLCFIYSFIMYLPYLGTTLKICLGILLSYPSQFVKSVSATYLYGHLLIEIHNNMKVELGFLNSSHSIISHSISAIALIATGYIYGLFTLQISTITLGFFSLVLSLFLTIPSSYLFSKYNPAPKNKDNKESSTWIDNVRSQLQVFFRTPVCFLMVINYDLSALDLSTPYIDMFLLESGLTDSAYSYFLSMRSCISILVALFNMRRDKVKVNWLSKTVNINLVTAVLQFLLCLYIFVCWLRKIWYPYMNDVVPETSNHQYWITIYMVFFCFVKTIDIFKNLLLHEYFQESIPAEDRGAAYGGSKFLTLCLLLVKCSINSCLPSIYLYLVNFTIEVFVQAGSIFGLFWYRRKCNVESSAKAASSETASLITH